MISIVIPTINEDKNILKTLNKIGSIKEFVNPEIIIVDDQSTDNTLKIARNFSKKLDLKIIQNKKKLGLGYALSIGFETAKKEFVMFIDADLSINKRDLIKLFTSRKKNSIVVGSRYLKNSKILGASKIKVYLSYLLNLIISKIFKLPVVDISHSFRIIDKNIKIKTKNFTHPGFFWEFTINAFKEKKTIREIPISFYDRKYGISKNSSLNMLKSVIRSYLNLLK